MALDDHGLTLCMVGWNPLAMTLQSVETTTSASIQWIRSHYTYPDNWVRGSKLFVITCLVCWLINLFIICLLMNMLKIYFL